MNFSFSEHQENASGKTTLPLMGHPQLAVALAVTVLPSYCGSDPITRANMKSTVELVVTVTLLAGLPANSARAKIPLSDRTFCWAIVSESAVQEPPAQSWVIANAAA